MTEQRTSAGRRPRYHSLFWPVVLIGVGVVWLLANLGVIPAANLGILLSLWPLLLVFIGLDIIFGRRWPAISTLIGLLMIALVIWLLIMGPSLGLKTSDSFFGLPIVWNNMESRTERFSEPLGDATSATINLHLSRWPANVMPASDPAALIDARVTYFGGMTFDVSGSGKQKTVTLGQNWSQTVVFGAWRWDDRSRWDIGLSPKVPLTLNVNAGSGAASLDLAQLTLSGLTLDGGSGLLSVNLPAGPDRYSVRADLGSGMATMTLADAATADLDIDGGSGLFTLSIGKQAAVRANLRTGSGMTTITLPAGSATRFEVLNGGSGLLTVASELQLVSRGRERNTGVWETAGFAGAERQVAITVRDMGSGALAVRMR